MKLTENQKNAVESEFKHQKKRETAAKQTNEENKKAAVSLDLITLYIKARIICI